ncbi:21706_t:CDS:1 [Gigaspora margarita]|uniref:21706_t:CDS:1 n=1 Tax=Gigaspora margarita TaxID=4874 RepID=A0ABM8VVA4_GIGMA|nr:21706_t:CDS:1 [Gigaspora margarita]
MIDDLTSDDYIRIHFNNNIKKSKSVLLIRIDEFLADIYICKVIDNIDGLRTETNLRNILRAEKYGSEDYDEAVSSILNTLNFFPGFEDGTTFREIIRKELGIEDKIILFGKWLTAIVVVGALGTLLGVIIYRHKKKIKNREN